MCVVCQEGKFPAVFDPQSGLQTKNRASCPGSRLRSEAEHPQGLTLRNRGSRLITTTPRQRSVSRLSERTCSRRATGLTALPLQVEEEESRRLIKHPWERCRLRGGATRWLMPGARSKRCRENRPLTGVGRLAERERPACGCAHQCRTRSLSARSAHPPLSRAASPAHLARRNAEGDRWLSARVVEPSDSP